MIVRNEYVISVILFHINTHRKHKIFTLFWNITSRQCPSLFITCTVTCVTLFSKISEPKFLVTVVTVVQSFITQLSRKHQNHKVYNHHSQELTCYMRLGVRLLNTSFRTVHIRKKNNCVSFEHSNGNKYLVLVQCIEHRKSE